MANVFIGCPTYDRIEAGTAQALYGSATQQHEVCVMINGKSLLNNNCNTLYAMCLNERENLGLNWFAMLHADIEPEAWWLDKLIDEAEKHEADMMSVVVPIKDERGLTSTALMGGNNRVYCRLTQRQVCNPGFPKTFDLDTAVNALGSIPNGELCVEGVPRVALLANTGCMVLRLKPWADKLFFQTKDAIIQEGGKFVAWDFPEDWMFSLAVKANGGKVMATTSVAVTHRGGFRFRNTSPWGTVARECG